MGARAYRLVERMRLRDRECIVEIGSSRGEGSTDFLYAWATRANVAFYSIDLVQRHPLTVIADGAEWLRTYEGRVGFCYLDNHDYPYVEIEDDPRYEEQRAWYAEHGLRWTREASEASHLLQAVALQKHTAIGAMVVLDDTWADAEGYHGKGARAVPWLLSHGWAVEKADGDRWEGYFALRRRSR